jgi:hypothetical protein
VLHYKPIQNSKITLRKKIRILKEMVEKSKIKAIKHAFAATSFKFSVITSIFMISQLNY